MNNYRLKAALIFIIETIKVHYFFLAKSSLFAEIKKESYSDLGNVSCRKCQLHIQRQRWSESSGGLEVKYLYGANNIT